MSNYNQSSLGKSSAWRKKDFKNRKSPSEVPDDIKYQPFVNLQNLHSELLNNQLKKICEEVKTSYRKNNKTPTSYYKVIIECIATNYEINRGLWMVEGMKIADPIKESEVSKIKSFINKSLDLYFKIPFSREVQITKELESIKLLKVSILV